MITFLPSASFSVCAKVLDTKRHNKQLIETEDLCKVFDDHSSQFRSYPQFEMWDGFYEALVLYGCAMYWEWQRKWYRIERGGIPGHLSGGALYDRFKELGIQPREVHLPPWLGDERLHSNHRAILLGKNYGWYSQFGWAEEPIYRAGEDRWPYWWPTREVI